MTLETDYLVVGAGLAGLAFADAIAGKTDATVTLVDRRHAAGGHWLDAYPFVRLHQPSLLYGVPSMPLGTDRITTHGIDEGLYERASGAEVVGYFDRLMQQRLLPSGQVSFLPRTDYLGDGQVRSQLTGRVKTIKVRKRLVDASYLEAAVPATSAPPFAVAADARCVPPGALAGLDRPTEGYVIIGAGKTANDTCQWLLEQGVDPERIRWVRPRDLWQLNRDYFQGGGLALEAAMGSVHQLEAAATSGNLDEYYDACGASGVYLRVDPAMRPTLMRGATSHEGEIKLLRQVEQVIRLGHVTRIERDRIVLEQGEVTTSPGWLHVHCTSDGAPARRPLPIFTPDRITMQHVRIGSPSFSYALIGMLEASGREDADKNRLAPPNAFVRGRLDWVRANLQSFGCGPLWNKEPDVVEWLDGRLNISRGLSEAFATPEGQPVRERFSAAVAPGLEGFERLLGEASPDERARFWPPAT